MRPTHRFDGGAGAGAGAGAAWGPAAGRVSVSVRRAVLDRFAPARRSFSAIVARPPAPRTTSSALALSLTLITPTDRLASFTLLLANVLPRTLTAAVPRSA